MAEVIGVIKTCPTCGASIESFQTRCSSCGNEVNEIRASETVQAFFHRLESLSELEYQRDVQQEKENRYSETHPTETRKITFGTILLWLFFFWILWVPILFRKAKGPYTTVMAVCFVVVVFSLLLIYGELNPSSTSSVISETTTDPEKMSEGELSETINQRLPISFFIATLSLSILGMIFILFIMKPKWTPEDKRRQSMIESFPIPNSKEDLTEFIILGTERIKPVNPILRIFNMKTRWQQEWNNIWIAKCNQVYKKARYAMKDDPSGLKTINEIMVEAELIPKK